MTVKFGKKLVGDNQPALIIAELSCNHLQQYDLAVKTIKAMKKAGADVIKLQTYTADTLTIDSNRRYFKLMQGTLWDGKTLHQLYEEAYTPWEWHPKLKKLALDLGLEWFSTPQDNTAVDFLKSLNIPAYKIASFEVTDIPFIEYVASQGKPIVISTGVAQLEDVKAAIKACHRVKNHQVIILKCTSAYPTPLEELNLKTITDISKRFKVIVGLSDHTLDLTSTITSVALGAKVIEKHFIMDRKLGGPDAPFSLEPDEFAEMVKAVRDTEKALGKVSYSIGKSAKKNQVFMRSLFVVKDMKKGDAFSKDNLRSIRPSFGLAPKYLLKVIGKKATKDIERGTPLKKNMVKGLKV